RFDQSRQRVLVPGLRRGVACDRALVAQAAGDAVQRLLRDPAHVDALAPRIALDLDDARILGAGLEQHLAHVVRIMLDGCGHGVDAGDPLIVFAHGMGAEFGAWGWGKFCGSGFSRELLLWPLPLRRQGEAGRGWSRFAMIQKSTPPQPSPAFAGEGAKLAAEAAPTTSSQLIPLYPCRSVKIRG